MTSRCEPSVISTCVSACQNTDTRESYAGAEHRVRNRKEAFRDGALGLQSEADGSVIQRMLQPVSVPYKYVHIFALKWADVQRSLCVRVCVQAYFVRSLQRIAR